MRFLGLSARLSTFLGSPSINLVLVSQRACFTPLGSSITKKKTLKKDDSGKDAYAFPVAFWGKSSLETEMGFVLTSEGTELKIRSRSEENQISTQLQE